MLQLTDSMGRTLNHGESAMNTNDIPLYQQRTLLRQLYNALAKLREISPHMPISEAQMFIAVALNEGASLTELSEALDLKKSSASRYLLNLSDRTRAGENGYGVVSRETDPQELRKNMYALTAKGRSILNSMQPTEG